MSTVFPSINSWITPRSSSSKVTSNNCQIITNQKISNVNKILIKASTILASGSVSGTIRYDLNVGLFSTTNNESGFIKELDITKYVVEKAKYDTLSIADRSSESLGQLYVNNTSYYTTNTKTINIVGENIKGAWEVWGISAFSTMIQSALNDIEVNNNGLWIYDGGEFKRVFTSGSFRNDSNNNPMSAQFRVFYTPLGESVKLNVPKTNPQLNQFCIPYSQQQPIVDNVSHGREMQSRSNRTGCEKKEVVRVLHSIKDVRHPRKGYYYREKDEQGNLTGNVWRLTECRIQIFSSTQIRVIETWSKNWTMESDNVPINREFRSWNIPADIVQRNLTWNDYCLITRKFVDLPDTALFSDQAKVELLRGLESSVNTLATECTNLWFYTKGADNSEHGAVMNCSAFGFGNSLVFSGKTKDNLSAGVQRAKSDNSDDNYQFCKDVYYCNEDGTLEKMYIQLGSALYNLNATGDADTQASYRYPEYSKTSFGWYNSPDSMSLQGKTLLKEKEFTILKDPAEQLNFTYQLHLMTDNPYLVIGSTWAATNPLTQRRTEAPTIKVWKLTKPIPQGAQVMTGDYGDVDTTPNLFVVNRSAEQPYVQFAAHDGAGICVTDEYNNVLIAYNGNDFAQFNLFFTHDYRSMAIMLKAGA